MSASYQQWHTQLRPGERVQDSVTKRCSYEQYWLTVQINKCKLTVTACGEKEEKQQQTNKHKFHEIDRQISVMWSGDMYGQGGDMFSSCSF